MSEYILANKFDHHRTGIALVGCGGTGGFVAEGLARLLLDRPGVQLILIDGDRVEEGNLGRQNFWPEDLGKFKAQALAERLARRYRRPIAYLTAPLTDPQDGPDPLSPCALVVGCVDNAPARSTIAGAVSSAQWWLDAGNGAEHGQVLVGNAPLGKLRRDAAFDPEKALVHLLPLPTLVRPELLTQEGHRPSCAQVEAAGEQGPIINQAMAVLVMEMVRRLLEGRQAWWQIFLDLEAGSLMTVCPTPEAVSRLTGVRLKQLVTQPEKRRGVGPPN